MVRTITELALFGQWIVLNTIVHAGNIVPNNVAFYYDQHYNSAIFALNTLLSFVPITSTVKTSLSVFLYNAPFHIKTTMTLFE